MKHKRCKSDKRPTYAKKTFLINKGNNLEIWSFIEEGKVKILKLPKLAINSFNKFKVI